METVEILQDGKQQTIQLPQDFHFEGDRVYIKRIGNALVLLPYDRPWDVLFESLDQFTDDFMDDRAQPSEQVREDVFE